LLQGPSGMRSRLQRPSPHSRPASALAACAVPAADAQLLHQAEHIDLVPALDDLAAGEAEDAVLAELDLLAGRRNPEEFAQMGARFDKVRGDFIAFGNDLIDLHVEIGEGFTEGLGDYAHSGRPRWQLG